MAAASGSTSLLVYEEPLLEEPDPIDAEYQGKMAQITNYLFKLSSFLIFNSTRVNTV